MEKPTDLERLIADLKVILVREQKPRAKADKIRLEKLQFALMLAETYQPR